MLVDNIRVSFMNSWLPLYYSCSIWLGNNRILKQKELNVQGRIVVSLTTTPSRIHMTWMVIESILRQVDKPDALLLYLSEEEFRGVKKLPEKLLRQKIRGLQIVFVRENFRPHNKYIHAMESFPKACIVTIDDDKIYPYDLIYNLKKYHKRHPLSICAVMAREIAYVNGELKTYQDWSLVKSDAGPKHSLISLGVSGVLFPPGSLHLDIFDKKNLKEKALLTDDLWIKVMALRNNTPIVTLAGCYSRSFLSVKGLAEEQLRKINISRSNNDLVFNDLINHYKIDQGMIIRSS